ncbi:MAG: hypothetical protein MUE93_02910 [Ignavibacteriaceae bacterium]|jgi:hypothetical protein|nr:hypothetical protein [Ignavibacteriaceae bacterium]
MKQNIHHLYYLFYPRGLVSLHRSGPVLLCKSGWIIIVFLLFSATTLAQEQTPPAGEFPVGSPIYHPLITHPDLFNSFVATGMNTIHQRADEDTKDFLTDFNLVAYNASDTTEYIYHYSTSYYSKWEAEKNVESNRVGVKHSAGEAAYWNDGNDTVLCWSSKGLTEPSCSLMYGPHYRQEKRYKRWLYGCTSGEGCLTYTPRFRMALDNHGGANPNEDVCIIKVVFRYKVPNTTTFIDFPFIERMLKVGDFNTEGQFDDFYLHPNPLLRAYGYWPNFILPDHLDQMVDSEPPINYIDWEEYTGIQFCVEWLRSDTRCTLYIDYAEVYDNKGWNDFIRAPEATADLIKNYAYSFKAQGWDNIKYWGGTDEPYTIDSYLPIHIVDSLIQSVQAPPLVVNFQPTWWHTLNVNGEDEIEMFYNIAKPSKITLSVNPVSADYSVIRYADLEWVRFNLQRTSALDSEFWFHVQSHGMRTQLPPIPQNAGWCVWRKPDPPELKAMVSLALAHGAKGIIFLWFDSIPQYIDRLTCVGVYMDCIVDSNGVPEPDSSYSLYYTIKDNLVPRLKGKLGNTLMKLDYTGNFLQLQ